MKNIFLTGEKGIGKSTIINKLVEDLDLTFGGYTTEREEVDKYKYFSIKSLRNGLLYPFAEVDLVTLEKNINTDNFKYHIPKFLKEDMLSCHAIILDELGFMENHIEDFTRTIYEILDSHIPVLGVLKDFDCQFLNKIRERSDCTVIRLNKDNRDSIYDKLIQILKTEIF